MTRESSPLIAREILFGNADRSGGQISPDGRHLSWIAPLDGIPNIWSAPVDESMPARAITADRKRGIQSHFWTHHADTIVFVQDRDGDENWHVYSVHVATGEVRDMTPFDGVQAHLHSSSPRHPGRILITLNRRDPRFRDLHSLDLATGKLTMVLDNPGFAGFLCDLDFMPRIATRPTDDGGLAVMRRDADGGWTEWFAFSSDDSAASGPIAVTADGAAMIMRDSRGRDTAALVRMTLADGATAVLAEDARADIAGMIPDPHTMEPLAYAVAYARTEQIALDPRIAGDIAFLDAQDLGDWTIMSRTADNRRWIVGTSRPTRPGAAWLYDRDAQALSHLYDTRPALADAPLMPMMTPVIPARDGLEMVSYLTLPTDADVDDAGRPRRPVPLVLTVHGGPHERDRFGYNPTHQWLANRGYAVLSVNFRGSTGFGKRHFVAALGEWGGRMDDDLTDAVAWAVEHGIADPARVAIMGASYGGYATLVGMTRHPEAYACGVDIVGPSNLQTLIDAIPPYWEAGRLAFYRSVGDPRTEDGRALLRDRSPVHRAGKINRPLLIAQGANDPRVKQAEADQMVWAMKVNGVPVTYILFPDEGHGFSRAPNRTAANAVTEAFLAQHLGGRCESITTAELAASSIEIREGGEAISGLVNSTMPA